MYHPTTRVLTLLELLQTCSQMSSAEIAQRLEVTPRSVRRYVTMLQDLGIPVESRPGRHGGYRLRPGYKLPPLMFTNDEAMAVTLGLLSSARLGLHSGNLAREGALAKLERVLPDAIREQVRSVQESLVLDLAADAESVDSEIVFTLGQAVRQNRRVWFRYLVDGDESSRAIDPYGLVFRNSRWYVVGWCHLRHAIRIFRLDRINKIRLLAIEFTPPEDFDPQEYVLQVLQDKPSQWQVEVLLEASMQEARAWVPVIMGSLKETNTGVLLACNTNNLTWMSYFLLELPCRVTILGPPELIGTLEQLGNRIASVRYQPVFESEGVHAGHG